MALVSGSHSSSSMAGPQTSFTYDVFLSFRGDTRTSFTDHLYKALKQPGFRTFRDDAMHRGRRLKPELEKTIHESAISVIVFSDEFASSTWCLDEVVAIIKEQETSSYKHEVIPVFYKVEPSDVRNQRGSYEKEFDKYDVEIQKERNRQKKKDLSEKVAAWKDSLKKAGSLAGRVYIDGYESEFIDDILSDIKKKLDYKALYIEDKLVGIKDDVTEIERWLQDRSPDAVTLLLDGMAGVGKTTLAKCIYNSNVRNYDARCFLAEIGKKSKQPDGMLDLQSQLLSTILGSEKKENIWNVDEGTNRIIKAICNKKVLLILDDVTSSQQLNALLGPQKFYPGSKLIITTKNKELFKAVEDHPKVQNIKTLSTGDAMELFSLYAFDQHQPIEPYIAQSELFVSSCMGLPLALKVLGLSLQGKTIDVWEDTRRKLEEIANPEIQEVLKVSYETLADDKDKDLFRHIACFFVGADKDSIVTLLAECDLYPVNGISNLTERGLLSVEHGTLMMHQLIMKMGREVVRQESPNDPGKRSRLWRHKDCFKVLQDHTGTRKVEALIFDMEMMNDEKFEASALEKMQNLILLQLNYVTFSGEFKNFPKHIRSLSWYGFSSRSIPSGILLRSLVVLDMSFSKLERVWDGFMIIGYLKFLYLSYSIKLIETPDFGGLPALERLVLRGCISLIKVHESIADLRKLVLVDLTGCRSLIYLPSLPPSIVELQTHGFLDLELLERVQRLHSESSLSVLGEAYLSNSNLFDRVFPDDWSNLVSLQTLYIGGLKITSSPRCIQTLPALKLLKFSDCSELESILGLPESLKVLVIHNNKSLIKIQPAARNLEMIVMKYNCPKLCEVEGRHMLHSADKVERRILQYLGFKSNAGEGMELGVEVSHEFGIFSTFVSDGQIPSSFLYQKEGPKISFFVPWIHEGSRISGFSACVILSKETTYKYDNTFACIEMLVQNDTKDVAWLYINSNQKVIQNVEKCAWLCLWRCGNLLEVGDEIRVHVKFKLGIEVEECCINLIYEDDEELDGEKAEAHHVNASDQMSWTDRMHKDISDYANKGDQQLFQSPMWPVL